MNQHFQIDEACIEFVRREIGILISGEDEAVLSESGSCDVQAGPGSGKTTLLVAKLAMLCQNWPDSKRGFCVLSHTNAAKNEIEARLRSVPILRKLLERPHFVGTFQTFVDQFLAIPFLRFLGKDSFSVDNERFEAHALTLFAKGDYATARSALRARFQRDPDHIRDVIGGLRFEGPDLRVTHPHSAKRGFPSAESATGRQLHALKCALRDEGYFRFEDMYAFAEACIAQFPYLIAVIRNRFPCAFVDELQDTSSSQDRIVQTLFGENACVLQQFGDQNQSIFEFGHAGGRRDSLFDRQKTLFVNSTRRFGRGIGRIVSRLTSIKKQELIGCSDIRDRENTIFVFSRPSVGLVISKFGDVVLEQLGAQELRAGKACVVGSRINEGDHARDHFPVCLSDYWSDFKSPRNSKPKAPDSLLGYVCEAKHRLDGSSFAEGFQGVMSGVLVFHRRLARETGLIGLETRADLEENFRRIGVWGELKRISFKLINPLGGLSRSTWLERCEELSQLVAGRPISALPVRVGRFLSWDDGALAVGARTVRRGELQPNTYVHRRGDREVEIHFDSIHKVKGETHAATMVVETFIQRQHDIKELLDVLAGERHGSDLIGPSLEHCKRLFVAASRPAHLLCLAIHDAHLNADRRKKLRQQGWNLLDVR